MSDSPVTPPSGKVSPSKKVQAYVFGAILVLLFVMVCRLFAPFFTVLLWSVLLYVLFSPLYQRVVRGLDSSKIKGKILRNVWAGVFSLGTVILILIPLSFVAFQFFRQIIDLFRFARDFFGSHQGYFSETMEKLSRFIQDITSDQIIISVDEIRGRILVFLSSGLQNVLQISSGVARDVSSFIVGLVFMVFSLFFFYLDGPYLLRLALHVIPIRRDYLGALVGKFKDITRNLFLGYIMVALVQAVMAYIIFTIFQVKGALVFASLTLFCAFIPMFGAGLVWLPIGMVRIFNGEIVGGIIFLVVSGCFISLLDNLLRPMFLQNRIQLHPLLIFFAILGGVSAFGFNGIILGPMVVILFLTVLDLFLTEHKIEQD
jgi:predicted PurR-regulated permease PerM